MKILVLTSRFPYPLEKGDKLRVFYQIEELSRHHEVHVISISDDHPDKSSLEEVRNITAGLYLVRITPVQRYMSLVRSMFSGLPLQVAWFYSPGAAGIIQKICTDLQPDHVYCQLARMAEYARRLPVKKSLDYMDSFGIGMERRATVARGLSSLLYRIEARRMLRYEAAIAGDFDHLTIISAQDKSQLSFPGAEKIRIVPNGIGETFFGYSRQTEKSHDIVFVGNMSYLPNIEAAEFLIHKVLPLCRADVNVRISGANPASRVKSLKSARVDITGWMDDIREAYASGRVFVAPMWSGTGQQNKILEAMAMGLPCVTTEPVNNAIGARQGTEILIASEPEEFAAHINSLLENRGLYESMREHSVRFAKQNFNWEQNGKLLSDIFAGK